MNGLWLNFGCDSGFERKLNHFWSFLW
jgi:hypothetical protein